MEEITRIENAACNDGFGPWHYVLPHGIPMPSRSIVVSYICILLFHVIKTIIPAACEHRDSEGNLVLSEMTRLN